MKVLVSGATGFVGAALVPKLRAAGHDVRSLERGNKACAPDIFWNVQTGEIDHAELDRWNGPDAVVHLAGENVATRRWSPEQKKRIRTSRVEATERLCASLLKLRLHPDVFMGASAIGFYGDRGEELLTEESGRGEGFLAELVAAWEESSECLRKAGTRVAKLRFGMIVDPTGGALKKMLPLFRAGLGGALGSGMQWLSWISLVDVLRVIEFALNDRTFDGVYNAVAPEPIRNRDFTKSLARALHRPAFLPVPAFVLRIALGEMADALLLTSQRAVPKRLLESGFTFEHRDLAFGRIVTSS